MTRSIEDVERTLRGRIRATADTAEELCAARAAHAAGAVQHLQDDMNLLLVGLGLTVLLAIAALIVSVSV